LAPAQALATELGGGAQAAANAQERTRTSTDQAVRKALKLA
jgi:hypothetical protein